mmetsp:Transcript_8965/g.20539  ORF Transcript_8965/g.20539 Transcript_8965/m.20539 type:complete len:388 (-) Transcript_8965:615-1778(-)
MCGGCSRSRRFTTLTRSSLTRSATSRGCRGLLTLARSSCRGATASSGAGAWRREESSSPGLILLELASLHLSIPPPPPPPPQTHVTTTRRCCELVTHYSSSLRTSTCSRARCWRTQSKPSRLRWRSTCEDGAFLSHTSSRPSSPPSWRVRPWGKAGVKQKAARRRSGSNTRVQVMLRGTDELTSSWKRRSDMGRVRRSFSCPPAGEQLRLTWRRGHAACSTASSRWLKASLDTPSLLSAPPHSSPSLPSPSPSAGCPENSIPACTSYGPCCAGGSWTRSPPSASRQAPYSLLASETPRTSWPIALSPTSRLWRLRSYRRRARRRGRRLSAWRCSTASAPWLCMWQLLRMRGMRRRRQGVLLGYARSTACRRHRSWRVWRACEYCDSC